MKKSNLLKCAVAAYLFAALVNAPAFGQGAAPAASCESLAKLALPDTTITMAKSVGAGEYKAAAQGPSGQGAPGGQAGPGGPGAPGGQAGPGAAVGPGGGQQAQAPNPAFCEVTAEIKPTGDSDIKIEVWLPISTWNGKYVAVGNMGWAGLISERNMTDPLRRGFAVAMTDTGHEGNSGAFVPGHPEKLIDFAYRGDHLMTTVTKALIAAFYGSGPRHSYWVSCSLGGEEALIEAKRYPSDYDGVVAGSPINPVTLFNAAQLWPAWISMKYPDQVIPAAKFTMIHAAVLKACASPTGQRLGFVDDPISCHFDPAVLACKGADASDCLTAGQVEMMHRLYQGPVNPRTGESINPGILPGVEIQYAQNGMTNPSGVAVDLYKYAVFQDPNWDWKTMDYDTAIAKAVKELNPLLVVEPNLNDFMKQGDKLMITIGGAETHSARDIANFYNTVLKNAGPGHGNQIRLFVNPGQGHCGGGAGADNYEKLGTIDQWVESGKAPDQILSSKVSGGKTVFTRPLCAYPAVAKYKGNGDDNDAANFVCAKP